MIRRLFNGEILAETEEYFSTAAERSRGLLRYKAAPSKHAAIFDLQWVSVFPLVHTFGMHFPIGIIFCSSKKEVLDCRRLVLPNRFAFPWRAPFLKARYLVETCEQLPENLRRGERLEWPEARV